MHACVSVCARVFTMCASLPRSTQEVSGESLPAELRLELPLPADSFYASTKPCNTHTHANTHMHAQPAQLLIGNCKMSREGGRLLSNSVSLCVDLCIPFPSRCLFLLNTNTEIFHCERAAFIALRIRSSCSLTFSDACQQSQRVATNNKFSIQP